MPNYKHSFESQNLSVSDKMVKEIIKPSLKIIHDPDNRVFYKASEHKITNDIVGQIPLQLRQQVPI